MKSDRRKFLSLIGGGAIMTVSGLAALNEFLSKKELTERMPVIFIGHGSPMHAISENPFTQSLATLGKNLSKPKAILVISAHWMTDGTWVTEMATPKTIHDFYGFPDELHAYQYPAPGSPEVARLVRESITSPQIHGDVNEWGFDHGTWTVLKHMYPAADIPVLQLSLDLSKPPEYHFKLGEQIAKLRDQGVLILGSGNIVHNLRLTRREENAKPHEWATEFDEWIKKKLEDRDFGSIVKNSMDSAAGRLSVPTPDHFYPLHYVIGASDKNDKLNFEFEEIQSAAISMRCFKLG